MTDKEIEQAKEFILWARRFGATSICIGDIDIVLPPKQPDLSELEPKDPEEKARLAAQIRYHSA